MKRWELAKQNESLYRELLMRTDINSLCASVLSSRGYDSIDEITDFLNASELEDPFSLIDMDKAVDAISSAVENGELICIYGDYDCDGITATVILYNYLENMDACVMYYIPEREEGYGLNNSAIDKMKENGVKLIITVDNGISAIDEAEYIYQCGMSLIITDHHQPSSVLPKADAIINPHRSDCTSAFNDLCGAGVAFKLCAALDGGNYDAVMEQYSDLITIATVADVVPLKSENRSIVKNGLQLISNSENPGLVSLIDKCGFSDKPINATSIAYGIAPKINASGRFGSPLAAVKTFLADDPDDADDLTEHLMNLNNLRKNKETEIIDRILCEINNNPSILNEKVLIFSGEGWHHGVIGIIASKLVEMFSKPCIIISVDGEIARGSARSFKGFNIFECFEFCSSMLVKYGGHECAGGLTIESKLISQFAQKVAEFADRIDKMPRYSIMVDKVLRSTDVTVENIQSLEILEPYGEDNPQPVFAVVGAKIMKIIPLSSGKYARLELLYDNANMSALLFSAGPDDCGLAVNDIVDMLVTLEISNFNSRQTCVLKIKDYRHHSIVQDKYFAAKDCYECIQRNQPIDEKLKAIIKPSVDELKVLFDYISKNVKTISIDALFAKITNSRFNYCKFRNCLDIYCELGYIKINHANNTITYFEKSFENSEIYKKLQAL